MRIVVKEAYLSARNFKNIFCQTSKMLTLKSKDKNYFFLGGELKISLIALVPKKIIPNKHRFQRIPSI